MAFESITFNLVAGKKVRNETLNGRTYLVVPMVMITEGVHNGSNGPLYYPADELSKTPASWNAKPLLIGHPEKVETGCSPKVISEKGVGMIMNTRWDAPKLRAEAWFEPDRLEEVEPRLLKMIQQGNQVEVSTGVFVDNEPVQNADWQGESYVAIARNYRPDHLAILLDSVGACSVADGAGLLQLNEDLTKTRALVDKLLGEINMGKKEIVEGLIANDKTKWGDEHKDFLMTQTVPFLESLVPVENQEPPKKEPPKKDPPPKKEPVANQDPPKKDPISVDEYIQNAPPEYRDVLASGLMAHNQRKAELIQKITSNSRNVFTKDELGTRSMKELEGLAALAAEPEAPKPTQYPSYAGISAPPPVANKDDELEKPLLPPVMNFEDN